MKAEVCAAVCCPYCGLHVAMLCQIAACNGCSLVACLWMQRSIASNQSQCCESQHVHPIRGNAVSHNMRIQVLYGHASGTTYSVNACASQCGETFHIQKAACNPAQTVATKIPSSIILLCWGSRIQHMNSDQMQSNLRTCLGREGTLCSGPPGSASTVVGSAADATTLFDIACTDCSLDELCTWSRAGSLLIDSALESVFLCPSAAANGLCDTEDRLSRFSL